MTGTVRLLYPDSHFIWLKKKVRRHSVKVARVSFTVFPLKQTATALTLIHTGGSTLRARRGASIAANADYQVLSDHFNCFLVSPATSAIVIYLAPSGLGRPLPGEEARTKRVNFFVYPTKPARIYVSMAVHKVLIIRHRSYSVFVSFYYLYLLCHFGCIQAYPKWFIVNAE